MRWCSFLLLLTAQCTLALQLEKCELEKDCSLKFGNDTLHCEVGHGHACRQLELESRTVVEHKSTQQSLYPFLSSIEIYDRLYGRMSRESFKFGFRLPTADVGLQGDVQGVLAEFHEHPSLDSGHYSSENPICRYFNFSGSDVPRAAVEREKMTISYNCIGTDIRPSSYVLRLQTIPGGSPLVYDILWKDSKGTDYFYSYDFYGGGEASVWSHQLIAVAQFKGYVNDMNTSLHVVFPRADLGAEISYYDVFLLEESSQKVIAENIIQVQDGVNDIFFNDVQPGHYKVKVEAQGYSCELSCLSLESSFHVAPPTSLATPMSTSNTAMIMAGVALAVLLLIAIGCLAFRRWHSTTGSPLDSSKNSHVSKGSHCSAKQIITVTSLADRNLERTASEYFCNFLRSSLGAKVWLDTPSMPRSTSDCGSVATPTGSDTGDELSMPVLTPTSDISDVEHPLVRAEVLNIVLTFSYASGDAILSGDSVLDLEAHPAMKNLSELDSFLRHIVNSKCAADRVLCVTFSTTQTESRAGTSISRATSRRRLSEDHTSLANYLTSDKYQLWRGVPQLLLPVERQKLYIHLGGAFSKTHADFRNSEHLLNSALEAYYRATLQPCYREGDTRSVVTINCESIDLASNYGENQWLNSGTCP